MLLFLRWLLKWETIWFECSGHSSPTFLSVWECCGFFEAEKQVAHTHTHAHSHMLEAQECRESYLVRSAFFLISCRIWVGFVALHWCSQISDSSFDFFRYASVKIYTPTHIVVMYTCRKTDIQTPVISDNMKFVLVHSCKLESHMKYIYRLSHTS